MNAINKLNADSESKLMIREVKGVFDFIKKSKTVDESDLIFLPVYKRKNVFGLIANVLIIKWFCFKYRNFFDNVYVFTNAHDFTTTSLLNSLKIRGSIYFEEFIERGTQSSGLVKLIDKYLFGVDSFYHENLPVYLPVNRAGMNICDWTSDKTARVRRVSALELTGCEQKKLLIIDSNDQGNENLNNVAAIYKSVLALCKKDNIKVIVKGHPRLGLSKSLRRLPDVIYIDNEIPLEFLSLNSIEHVIGFYSSSLFAPEFSQRAKSLLFLTHSDKENFYKEYLLNNGFNRDNFVLNVKEIIDIQRVRK